MQASQPPVESSRLAWQWDRDDLMRLRPGRAAAPNLGKLAVE